MTYIKIRQIQRQSTVRTSALHERRHHHLQSSREMGRLRIPARSQGLGDPALRTHRRPCRRVRRARLRQVLQEGLAARQNPQAHPEKSKHNQAKSSVPERYFHKTWPDWLKRKV